MARGILDGELPDDPFEAFAEWYGFARDVGVHEPDAAILATSDGEGRPSARHVLVKQVDGSGFTFYTNKSSRKGADLAVNPSASTTVGTASRRLLSSMRRRAVSTSSWASLSASRTLRQSI